MRVPAGESEKSGPAREPLILPFAPRRGWAAADRARRIFATGLVLTVVVALASTARTVSVRHPGPGESLLVGVYVVLVALAGPPMCYSLARVLRPHPPGVGYERILRHWAAAVATPYGLTATFLFFQPTTSESSRLWLVASQLNSVILHEAVTALVLGPLTLAWGLVAVLARAVGRRWPDRVRRPGVLSLRDDAEAEDARVAG